MPCLVVLLEGQNPPDVGWYHYVSENEMAIEPYFLKYEEEIFFKKIPWSIVELLYGTQGKQERKRE
jgi:hypothetical protein